jgi:hypothetical protein
LKIATRLAPIELLETASDKRVRLGSLWEGRPAVLIFLRHFG